MKISSAVRAEYRNQFLLSGEAQHIDGIAHIGLATWDGSPYSTAAFSSFHLRLISHVCEGKKKSCKRQAGISPVALPAVCVSVYEVAGLL